MDEAPAGVVMALRASSSAPPPVASSSRAAAEPVVPVPVQTERRQRYSVELKVGETTIVSWKKLVKDGSRTAAAPGAVPSGGHQGLESRIAPAGPDVDQQMGCEPKDAQPPANRFSAVIEKIERLYMGRESSDDEELDEIPDDDQYDTEDSFIDDTELNDYFQVDKSTTKHHGFFVNRGKLEHMEANSSPHLVPKKRRRKDSVTTSSEKDTGRQPTEFVDVSNMKMKNAARHAPLVAKNPSCTSNNPTPPGERYQDGKHQKTKLGTATETLKKKVDPSVIKTEVAPLQKLPNKDLSHDVEVKDHKEQKVAVAPSRDTNKVKTVEALGTTDATREKGSSKVENDPVTSAKIRAKEKNGTIELPDLNIPGSMCPIQAMSDPMRVKEAIVRPKGSMLERAIRELERVVAEFRSSKHEIQVADTAQGVKKRLPLEIKPKLAKVARLANSQGKIASEEFFNRLMGILGHLVQQKTLKRHLKEMVELGLSAKQAKSDRFQQIKKEVIEMIKARVAASRSRLTSSKKVGEQQTGSSDHLPDTSSDRALKAKLCMDEAIEDKICDLYDLYVEGMDEAKGPQMRKLYGELAELWPAGYVDNLGIKEAISRATTRKKALRKQHEVQDEKLKRKRLSSAVGSEDTTRLNNQPRAGLDRLSDAALPLNGSSDHHVSKHQDKGLSRGNTSISSDVASKAIVSMKKAKRSSPEGGLSTSRSYVTKLLSRGNDKDASLKQTVDASESYSPKRIHNPPALSGYEQSNR